MSNQILIEDVRYRRSIELYSDASKFLAGGVSSNFRLGGTPVPMTFTHGEGARLYDADGNQYIDYALGMGPVILGHAPTKVIDAVAATLGRGQLFAGQNQIEFELAEKFCEIVPCAERVRFSMSGSEAAQAAIRLARGFTGRSKIVRFEGHYHGWLDPIFVGPAENGAGEYAAKPLSGGQPSSAVADVYILPWNDIEVFEDFVGERADEIAGVIMEPILCNTSTILPKPGYLERVRELATRLGFVLIFDEVITGFRASLRGAQGYLGVTPDLATFAKAMAAGFPISAIAGRADIMEQSFSGNVMLGGTYNSNLVSCAAALETLRILERGDGAVYQQMEQVGLQLMSGIRELAGKSKHKLLVQGIGTVFNTAFTDETAIQDWRAYSAADAGLLARFARALQEEGIYITRRGTWFLSAAHSSIEVETTLAAVEKVLDGLPATG